MGAYLNLRLNDPDKASDANEYINNHEAAILITSDGRLPHFEETNENKARALSIGANFENHEWHPYAKGAAQIKVSGLLANEATRVKNAWANLIADLHDEFDLRVDNYSGALHPAYFSEEQIRKITDDGGALVGTPPEGVERYQLEC